MPGGEATLCLDGYDNQFVNSAEEDDDNGVPAAAVAAKATDGGYD
jgi:hypothetical protein